MKNTEFALFTPSAFSTMLEVIICPALLVASDNKTVQDLLLRVLLKPVQRLLSNRRIDPLLCSGEHISCL